MVGSIILSSDASKMIEQGVLTIYSRWIDRVIDAKPGDWVYVMDWRGRVVGQGFYEGVGAVGVRVYYYGDDEEIIDIEYILEDRIDRAYGLRNPYIDKWSSFRLVNADGDWLPGLIVDIYDDVGVLQSSAIGIESVLGHVGSALRRRGLCERVYLKNDHRGRRESGLPIYKHWLVGSGATRILINEDGLRFYVDIEKGQKTGFFLDQRMNRLILKGFSVDNVLDLFSYTGGFGLHLASMVAREVVAVEESDYAVSEMKRNISINGLSDKVKIHHMCVEDYLSEEGQRGFDLVISDPPAYIQSRELYRRGLNAYRKLYSLIFRVVRDGGLVFASSCSYFLSRDKFLDLLRSAAMDSKREIYIMGYYRASPDHLHRPIDRELDYLKAYILGVD